MPIELSPSDIKTREILTATPGADPEEEFVEKGIEGKEGDFAGERKTAIERVEKAELADMVTKGLVKILAGMRGEAKGLDLSGVETEGPDWNRRIQTRLEGIGARERLSEAKKERRRRRVEGLKEREFTKNLNTFRDLNKRGEETQLKLTTERQRLKDMDKGLADKEKSVSALVAMASGEDEGKRDQALAQLEVGGFVDPDIAADIRDGNIPASALIGVIDAGRAKREVINGIRTLYGNLELKKRLPNKMQEKRIGQISKLDSNEITTKVPFGKLTYAPTQLEVYKELKGEMKIEKLKSKKGWDTGRLDELQREEAKFKEDPLAYTKEYTRKRIKAKMNMIQDLGEWVRAKGLGADVSGYRIGVGGFGNALQKMGE